MNQAVDDALDFSGEETPYAIKAIEYAEAVVANEIPACEWVQKACERQLNDLITFDRKSSLYRFNPELLDRYGRPYRPADNLCAFIERLPHVKGPLANQLIELVKVLNGSTVVRTVTVTAAQS